MDNVKQKTKHKHKNDRVNFITVSTPIHRRIKITHVAVYHVTIRRKLKITLRARREQPIIIIIAGTLTIITDIIHIRTGKHTIFIGQLFTIHKPILIVIDPEKYIFRAIGQLNKHILEIL
uniref:Uncharacterized protein n=1 Tax=CRESS virus SC_1_H1_2017 TaxID=2723249 RepID=A0A6H0X6Z1_9VIRU|nr:hypothetical protein [CRESS virus SC_1_H1_2017]